MRVDGIVAKIICELYGQDAHALAGVDGIIVYLVVACGSAKLEDSCAVILADIVADYIVGVVVAHDQEESAVIVVAVVVLKGSVVTVPVGIETLAVECSLYVADFVSLNYGVDASVWPYSCGPVTYAHCGSV